MARLQREMNDNQQGERYVGEKKRERSAKRDRKRQEKEKP